MDGCAETTLDESMQHPVLQVSGFSHEGCSDQPDCLNHAD